MKWKKEILESEKVASTINPCIVHAVKAGNFVFVSGTIGKDPDTGEVPKGDVVTQAELIIRNMKAILKKAGSSLKDVVKVTMYLTSWDHIDKIFEIRNKYFGDSPTASTGVQIKSLFGPDLLIEIEAIAVIPE